MRRKPDLDRTVALELGVPLSAVRRITRAFIDTMAEALATNEDVDLQGFGLLRVRIIRTPPGCAIAETQDGRLDKIYVSFTKKSRLTKALANQHKKRKIAMEKYGVDESFTTPDSLEKHAANSKECPKCGTTLEQHGRVLKCPVCGTEPFEKGDK